MQVTQRQVSAWDLEQRGYTQEIISDKMNITQQAVSKLTRKAEKAYFGGCYRSKGRTVTYKDPAELEDIQWHPKPYNLAEWRIDSTLVPTTCSYCHKDLETSRDAAWCAQCGRWFQGYAVGREDPDVVYYCW